MKNILKPIGRGILIGLGFFIAVVSLVYAASNLINSVTEQTISKGDQIGSGWFQEVNDKILNLINIQNNLSNNQKNISGTLIGTNVKPGKSCKDILDRNPLAQGANGTYWIDLEQNGNSFEVYCDMTTDGGGWMLFARTYGKNSSYKYGFDTVNNGRSMKEHTFINIEGLDINELMIHRHDTDEFYSISFDSPKIWPAWGTYNSNDGYTLAENPEAPGQYIRLYDSDSGKRIQFCTHDSHNDECGSDGKNDYNNYGDAGGNDNHNMLWNGSEFDPTGIIVDFAIK